MRSSRVMAVKPKARRWAAHLSAMGRSRGREGMKKVIGQRSLVIGEEEEKSRHWAEHIPND